MDFSISESLIAWFVLRVSLGKDGIPIRFPNADSKLTHERGSFMEEKSCDWKRFSSSWILKLAFHNQGEMWARKVLTTSTSRSVKPDFYGRRWFLLSPFSLFIKMCDKKMLLGTFRSGHSAAFKRRPLINYSTRNGSFRLDQFTENSSAGCSRNIFRSI